MKRRSLDLISPMWKSYSHYLKTTLEETNGSVGQEVGQHLYSEESTCPSDCGPGLDTGLVTPEVRGWRSCGFSDVTGLQVPSS